MFYQYATATCQTSLKLGKDGKKKKTDIGRAAVAV